MNVLFIGGTGNISTACSRLALERGMDLFILNRGKRLRPGLEGASTLVADINEHEQVKEVLKGQHFDVVVNFIAFTPKEVRRDIELFSEICDQYIFISSASVYQKPPSHPVITESTPLANPYWDYSRDKITCEEILMEAYRERAFPVTIVRPSHTYDMVIPAAVGSWEDFTLIHWMRSGKPVIIHGDGSSLWAMTHSDDFALGFTGLLGNRQSIGHPFHITSDELLTWNQIYEMMAHAAGAQLNAIHVSSDFICEVADDLDQGWMRGNLHGDKANSVVFDNTKIKRFVPAYKATIPFSEGIKRTIAWFDEQSTRVYIDETNKQLMEEIIARYKR